MVVTDADVCTDTLEVTLGMFKKGSESMSSRKIHKRGMYLGGLSGLLPGLGAMPLVFWDACLPEYVFLSSSVGLTNAMTMES